MFVDQVKVIFRAGGGGSGCLSFRHEKGVPRGGPDGGRGGDGGSIFLISDAGVRSLAAFRYHPIYKARRGAHGEGSNRTGKSGPDLHLAVPPGTVVRDREDNRVVFDFTAAGLTFLAAKGGKGGRGNASFASSVHQAPRIREEGKPGEEKGYLLELKLIADVGLVGFPNVGKSTLISKISAARPAIADYPFTTLIPNLGVVDLDETESFVVADIPGLIEGAHEGHGLGIRFLRHIERTKVLVHLIDVSSYTEREPADDYKTIMRELEAFNPDLCRRKQIIVANKTDLLDDEKEEDLNRLESLRRLAAQEKYPFAAISAAKSTGLRELIRIIGEMLHQPEQEESL